MSSEHPQPASGEAVVGFDGRRRCAWAGSGRESDTVYLDYHDQEWGVAVHGEQRLLERLCLEAFQSGLSWLTILRKRPDFRVAFAGFDADVVSAYGEQDVDRLLNDASIVRNRRKIEATVANARATVALRAEGGLDALVWGFAPADHRRPTSMADVDASTRESVALASALKAAGFAHLGPVTVYAAMQACGIVDDHVAGCFRGLAQSPA